MKNASKDFRIGVLLACINAFSLGLLGIIDKIGATQSGINPFVFSTKSVLFGFLFVTIFAFLFRKGKFIDDIKKTPRNAWFYILLVGISASGFFVIFRFIGLTESLGTFATLSQVITTSLTAILAFIFLKERLKPRFWGLFLTIIIATYFVSVGSFTLQPISQGDYFILLGTIFLAASNIFAKLATIYASPLVLSVGRFFFGGILLFLASLFFFNETGDLFTFTLWAMISGFFWSINNTAFNYSVQKIGVILLTSILMLGPVITMILESLILKQAFSQIQVIAAFVVIICGILMVRTMRK